MNSTESKDLDALVRLADESGSFFLYQLVGALKVVNPELLKEVARDNLRVHAPDALAGYDAIIAEGIHLTISKE
tara:strand:+ start:329 stop:550 length:222 start_codon:yes stop_codon:yes gene_type:complete